MKITLLTATVVVGLSATAAFAGEGRGNPFPFRMSGTTTVTDGRAALPNAATDPFPFRGNGSVISSAMASPVMPTDGAEGPVQTANSLPPNFETSTPGDIGGSSMQQSVEARHPALAPLPHG